jgi:hypothetical protein
MDIVAKAEVRGESICPCGWAEVKVIKTYRWKRKDSIALAIFAAESVLYNIPDDVRGMNVKEARKALKDAWHAAIGRGDEKEINKVEMESFALNSVERALITAVGKSDVSYSAERVVSAAIASMCRMSAEACDTLMEELQNFIIKRAGLFL